MLDSCGIGLTQGHHFFDIGQGKKDEGQFDGTKEIFGASGALAVYRKSALNTVCYVSPEGRREYFDELLHYKNDVDLSYRLQWAGQKCLFIPSVRVYHDRQVDTKKRKSLATLESSLYGQLFVLKKNFDPRFSFTVKFKTFLRKWGYVKWRLAYNPLLIKQLFQLGKDAAKIEDRRKKMPRAVSPKEIEQLMR